MAQLGKDLPRHNRLWKVLAALLVLALVACGGGSDDNNTNANSGAVGGLETGPEPFTTSVDFLGVLELGAPVDDTKVLRFAATITNPNPYPVVGAVAEWIAKDATGSIIGSFGRPLAPLAPNERRIYVGGGPMTAGAPSTVELTAKDPGRRADQIPTPFQVANVVVRRVENPISGRPEYDIEADITSGGQQYRRDQVDLNVILKDASGKVIGADFEVPFDMGIPEQLPPNTRFKASFEFVPAQGTVETAEVYAYAG